jgi:hypothetical protein
MAGKQDRDGDVSHNIAVSDSRRGGNGLCNAKIMGSADANLFLRGNEQPSEIGF